MKVLKRSGLVALATMSLLIVSGGSIASASSHRPAWPAWPSAAQSARVARSARLVLSVRWARSATRRRPAGPAGPAGPIGPQGPRGPVGPGGNNRQQFLFEADVNTASTTVDTFGSVKLLASCSAAGRVSLNAVALNVAPGILTERDGINFQIVPRFGIANTTAAILLTPLSSASSRADVTVHYVSNAGENTTINAAAVDLALTGPTACRRHCIVYGTSMTF